MQVCRIEGRTIWMNGGLTANDDISLSGERTDNHQVDLSARYSFSSTGWRA